MALETLSLHAQLQKCRFNGRIALLACWIIGTLPIDSLSTGFSHQSLQLLEGRTSTQYKPITLRLQGGLQSLYAETEPPFGRRSQAFNLSITDKHGNHRPPTRDSGGQGSMILQAQIAPKPQNCGGHHASFLINYRI